MHLQLHVDAKPTHPVRQPDRHPGTMHVPLGIRCLLDGTANANGTAGVRGGLLVAALQLHGAFARAVRVVPGLALGAQGLRQCGAEYM